MCMSPMSGESWARSSSPPEEAKDISFMLRSIRWTLQLWHAAILIAAVVSIGLTSFFAIRQARYRQVDGELEAAGQLIVAHLRRPIPPDRRPPPNNFGGAGMMDQPQDGPRFPNFDNQGGGPGGPGGPGFDGPGGPANFNTTPPRED